MALTNDASHVNQSSAQGGLSRRDVLVFAAVLSSIGLTRANVSALVPALESNPELSRELWKMAQSPRWAKDPSAAVSVARTSANLLLIPPNDTASLIDRCSAAVALPTVSLAEVTNRVNQAIARDIKTIGQSGVPEIVRYGAFSPSVAYNTSAGIQLSPSNDLALIFAALLAEEKKAERFAKLSQRLRPNALPVALTGLSNLAKREVAENLGATLVQLVAATKDPNAEIVKNLAALKGIPEPQAHTLILEASTTLQRAAIVSDPLRVAQYVRDTPAFKGLIEGVDQAGSSVVRVAAKFNAAAQPDRFNALASEISSRVESVRSGLEAAKKIMDGGGALGDPAKLINSIGSAQSGLQAASIIADKVFNSPKVAQVVSTISTVIGEVQKARSVISSVSSLTSLAPMAALGPVGIGLAAFSVLGGLFGGGPSETEQQLLDGMRAIQEGVNQLRQEIADFRREVQENFKRIAELQIEALKKLDKVLEKLDKVLEELNKLENSVNSGFKGISNQLEQLNQAVQEGFDLLIKQHRAEAYVREYEDPKQEARDRLARRAASSDKLDSSEIERVRDLIRKFYLFANKTSREPVFTGSERPISLPASFDKCIGPADAVALLPTVWKNVYPEVQLPELLSQSLVADEDPLRLGGKYVNPWVWLLGVRAFLELQVSFADDGISKPIDKYWLNELWQAGVDIRELFLSISNSQALNRAGSKYLEAMINAFGLSSMAGLTYKAQIEAIQNQPNAGARNQLKDYEKAVTAYAESIKALDHDGKILADYAAECGVGYRLLGAITVWYRSGDYNLATAFMKKPFSSFDRPGQGSGLGLLSGVSEYILGLKLGVADDVLPDLLLYLSEKDNKLRERIEDKALRLKTDDVPLTWDNLDFNPATYADLVPTLLKMRISRDITAVDLKAGEKLPESRGIAAINEALAQLAAMMTEQGVDFTLPKSLAT